MVSIEFIGTGKKTQKMANSLNKLVKIKKTTKKKAKKKCSKLNNEYATPKKLSESIKVNFSNYSKISKLDEKNIGTEDYLGLAYFWNRKYRFYLRDAPQRKRVLVHNAFKRNCLKLNGESPAHDRIIKRIFPNS